MSLRDFWKGPSAEENKTPGHVAYDALCMGPGTFDLLTLGCPWESQDVESVAAFDRMATAVSEFVRAADLARIAELENAIHPLLFSNMWTWEMLPNGARGWKFSGFINDHEMRALMDCGSANYPAGLERQ